MRRFEALLGRQPQPKPVRYSALEALQSLIIGQSKGWTTWGVDKADPISFEFVGFVDGALKANGVVSAIEQTRINVFAEARFLFQRLSGGRPRELYGSQELSVLERPWTGGTTGDLLARMLLDADMCGNAYVTRVGDELVRLRPDWVTIVLAGREGPNDGQLMGMRKVGYLYHHGGQNSGSDPESFDVDDVAHFAPYPDPAAWYRGMSWLTPVVREVQADLQATKHKLKFFENAATPNLAVSLAKEITPEKFEQFVELMDRQHKGADNAYKTLYTAGGADVTVIGKDMQQLDFKVTQGAGETRLAAAARVHPVIVGLSEGMQGSSLNAGNYAAAKRSFADGTMRPLWRNAAGSLEVLVPPPDPGSRLWVDTRDIAFLRDDEKDTAEIAQIRATTIRTYIEAGFTAASSTACVDADNDVSLLEHTGLFSVQLQEPGGQGGSDVPAA